MTPRPPSVVPFPTLDDDKSQSQLLPRRSEEQEVTVRCGTGHHMVRLQGDTVVSSHPDVESEAVLATLGGSPPPCVGVTQVAAHGLLEWAGGRAIVEGVPAPAAGLLDVAAVRHVTARWDDASVPGWVTAGMATRATRLLRPLALESLWWSGVDPGDLLGADVKASIIAPGSDAAVIGEVREQRLEMRAWLAPSWLEVVAMGQVWHGGRLVVDRNGSLRHVLQWLPSEPDGVQLEVVAERAG